jgi:predicted  nucleic acid-binding Zn-ribbon protein
VDVGKSLIYSQSRVFVLTKIESGNLIFDLRKKIQEIRADLNQLGEPVSEIPELITSANLLRSNEYLSKANEKKTELLSAYAQYSNALEKLLSTVFDIQNDLKEILTQQSSMISRTRKRSKTKTKSRIAKK